MDRILNPELFLRLPRPVAWLGTGLALGTVGYLYYHKQRWDVDRRYREERRAAIGRVDESAEDAEWEEERQRLKAIAEHNPTAAKLLDRAKRHQ